MTNFVKKRDGRMVKFKPELLCRSLVRSGAKEDVAKKITNEISNKIKDLKTTENIYKEAFDKLEKVFKPASMKYSIKKSIFKFGPTGFVFEKFVAVIFRRLGYEVETNVHIDGCCSKHEVDVYAKKKERIAMEIKFHNRISGKTDIKTALYVWARFQDLQFKNKKKLFNKKKVDTGILVTNTRFTISAINYANCVGMKLLSWNTPKENNLYDMIKKVEAHPITCLPSVSKADIKRFYQKDIIVCSDLLKYKQDKKKLGVSPSKANQLFDEAEMLCK